MSSTHGSMARSVAHVDCDDLGKRSAAESRRTMACCFTFQRCSTALVCTCRCTYVHVRALCVTQHFRRLQSQAQCTVTSLIRFVYSIGIL